MYEIHALSILAAANMTLSERITYLIPAFLYGWLHMSVISLFPVTQLGLSQAVPVIAQMLGMANRKVIYLPSKFETVA